MKKLIIILLILTTSNCFSQRRVTGIIYDNIDNFSIPGVTIKEINTDNTVKSETDGSFIIITQVNNAIITIELIGYENKTINISSDTIINIYLEPLNFDYLDLDYWNFESRWLTIGTKYDILNSTFGFLLSNGLDEKPLIHFEDFDDRLMFKISGNTDFRNDYSLESKISYNFFFNPNYPSLEYIKTNYSKIDYSFSDINFSFGIFIRSINTNLNVKLGYQTLNELNNFGTGVGLQRGYSNKLYYGFMISYWFDYITYNIYFHSFVFKSKISIKGNYERINNFDFLNIGVNYTFKRNKSN
jgi:hypothetical protein